MTRGSAISSDVRMIIVRMAATRLSTKKISYHTRYPLRTIQHIIHAFRTTGSLGSNEAKVRKCKLNSEDVEDLLHHVMSYPDSQLTDYRRYLLTERNIDVSVSTIWRTLHRAGYSQKTITKAARERSWSKRADFIKEIVQYEPHELVFIDESSFDKRTSNRVRAWSKIGTRIIRPVFFYRGERYSILPALSLEDGVFHVNIVQGSFDMRSFHVFIDQLLLRMSQYDVETHPSKSVIVLDNCQIHKNPETLQMILDRGMRYVFLPPYSPDYNPIELAFSSMKAWFRKHNDEVMAAWGNERTARLLLIDMAFTATAAKAVGWFRKCNYIN